MTASSSPSPVAAFFAALEAQDLESLAGLLSEDSLTVLPMSHGASVDPNKVLPGRAAGLAHYEGAFGRFETIRYTDHVVSVADEGRVVFVENRAECILADGRPYANVYVWRFELEPGPAGRIVGIREYVNPIVAGLLVGDGVYDAEGRRMVVAEEERRP